MTASELNGLIEHMESEGYFINEIDREMLAECDDYIDGLQTYAVEYDIGNDPRREALTAAERNR